MPGSFPTAGGDEGGLLAPSWFDQEEVSLASHRPPWLSVDKHTPASLITWEDPLALPSKDSLGLQLVPQQSLCSWPGPGRARQGRWSPSSLRSMTHFILQVAVQGPEGSAVPQPCRCLPRS